MVFEQVGGFLRNATSQLFVTPLTIDEKAQIIELVERMKQILDTAAKRQQDQAR